MWFIITLILALLVFLFFIKKKSCVHVFVFFAAIKLFSALCSLSVEVIPIRDWCQNVRNDGAVWRCTGRYVAKCGAVLWTKNSLDTVERVMMTDHSHDANPDAIIRLRADYIART